MGKITRLINHIQRGTLLDRIQRGWRERTKRRRQFRWNARNGKRDYMEARIECGLRMRLHFESELARRIYCDDFEREERHFVSAFLRTGDVFVDVGANIGLFSLIAAYRVGHSGAVYAFEPCRKTFHRLLENIKLNNFRNTQCVELALSDESGEFPFYTSEEGLDAWNSIAHPIEGKSFTREFIQCITWDRFAHLHQLVGRVAMMKIDVEGWESRVLEGARESLLREDAPLLQVEFTDKASISAGTSCKRLYQLLESLGYRIFSYNPSARELIHDPPRESYPYVNLMATKDIEEAHRRLRNATARKWLLDK
jgi:FkbM family methyltransferase